MTAILRSSLSVLVRLSAASILVCAAACTGLGSDRTVREMVPGSIFTGSTTESQGDISRSHLWTVELTKTDVVFVYGDRRVVLEGVVGRQPLTCRANQQTGKSPDVILELPGHRTVRWKGWTIDVDDKHYDIPGPGTFTIDSAGTMKRI